MLVSSISVTDEMSGGEGVKAGEGHAVMRKVIICYMTRDVNYGCSIAKCYKGQCRHGVAGVIEQRVTLLACIILWNSKRISSKRFHAYSVYSGFE